MMIKDYLVSILGDYELQLADNGNVIGGVAGLDFPWLLSALILVIVLYSVFRLWGCLFNGK